MSRVAFHGLREEQRPFVNMPGGQAAVGDEPPVTIPVCRPRLPTTGQLLPYLQRIDASRIYSNYGPLALELESRLAEHFGLPPGGVACASSGTAALFGAIIATAGRASDSRPWALVPALTFTATAAAAEQAGYRPYLVDVDPATWMLDPDCISAHPMLDRVGLVVPVAPFGRPVPVEPWRGFRARTGVPVVIDGAASFQNIAEAPTELLGDLPVCISFHATKSFATGEGGAVATSNAALAERVMQVLNFGFSGGRDSACASTNGKMSEYHAAIGLAELDSWTEKRAAFQAVAECYRRTLAGTSLISRFIGAPDIGLNYALFACRAPDDLDAIRESLRLWGVDFRHWYGTGLSSQSYYADCPRDRLDVTERLASELLGIPMAPDLSPAAVACVVAALGEGAVTGCEREIA